MYGSFLVLCFLFIQHLEASWAVQTHRLFYLQLHVAHKTQIVPCTAEYKKLFSNKNEFIILSLESLYNISHGKRSNDPD